MNAKYEGFLYQLLDIFGQYTLEAIIIHVLGSVFNCITEYPMVRVPTLIDQLDRTVLVQAEMFMKRKKDINPNFLEQWNKYQ